MSFKRKTENLAFSVSITPDKKKKFEIEDTRSFAVLAPFNPFPKISFENIKLQSTAVREIYLVNPTENALQVELTKLPDESRGFNWSATDFDLAKESQTKLVISWTPTEYGSWHDNIKIINKKTKKPLSELKLSSATEEPPKVLKRSLRSRGAHTKKLSSSSKEEVEKKNSTVKIQSENKENKVPFISKSKKPTPTGVCIENENVIIYESRKPFKNQTFTQINEEDLGEKLCDEARDQSVATSLLSQNSNLLQVRPTTSRRGTFDVVETLTTTRRSTYSLRNKQLFNVINVEEEKIKFELLASPDVHNKSLELAASKLVCQNIKTEACTVDKAEQVTDVNSATFTVQPSTSYNVTGDPASLSSVTFNKVHIPAQTASSFPLLQSPTVNQLLNSQLKERISLESAAGSEKFYDSLEEKRSPDSLAKGGFEIDWEIYDIDKFSSRTSEKLQNQTCSVVKLDREEDETLKSVKPNEKNNDIFHYRGTLSEAQASSSNIQLELPFRNITHRRKSDNFQSLNLSNNEKEPDCFENLISPKDLNQTKDTLLQLDEDFGKFTLSIVSSSPINHRNASYTNLNRTYTPARNNPLSKDNLENSNEENAEPSVQEGAVFTTLMEEDINGKCPKNLKISKADSDKEVERKNPRTRMKYPAEKINVPTNEEQNDQPNASSEQKAGSEKEQMQHSLTNRNSHTIEQYPEVCNGTKHTLEWVISPPQNSKEEKSVSTQYMKGPNLSTRELPTPVRYSKRKSTLPCLASNTNISQQKAHISLQKNTNCSKSSELPNCGGKNVTDSKNPKRSGIYSEEVFLVPQAKVTRSSLQKTTNGSPPKIRRLSQDIKVKRLSTPSMPRKLILSSTTEVRKQHKTEVPRSLPRSATWTKKRKSLKVADWVPAMRKLKLTSTGSQSDEELSPTSADLATPDPFLTATTLNPFAKGGLYFNNKWLNEQETELLEWADRMLRPPNELELDRDQTERGTLHRLNALRATAFNILTSTEVATVLSRVKAAVEKNIISIRSDRQLHADLGLQHKIISLLMGYNPLWLRLCLEAVYQCNIPLKCHSDEAGLREFVRRHVLNDDYLRQTYAHPTVPHLMLPEFENEMKKFTVYKFLVIVYLLDLVKNKKVILHNPCLFKKDSKVKSSKDILIEFNKEFVSGAGDITRILRSRGYEVSHCQTYIDEFDFSLTCTKDLRDGVRLTKLAENLVGDKSLCSKLRVPAVSNLQKKFNAEVAFLALKKAGYDLPSEVSPKDISDGHNEKTLSFLWHLRGIYQERAVLIIITKWRETKQLRADRKEFLKFKKSAIKIQRWYRKIKLASSLTIEELKKGREAREHFLRLRTVVVHLQRRFRKRKEKRDLIKKGQAAAVIQKWYRNRKEVFKDRQKYKELKTATITVQRAFRNYKSRKTGSALEERKYFINIRTVVIMLQRRFRAIQVAKLQRQNYLAIKTAVIKIQRRFRAIRLAKPQRIKFLATKKSTITIQRRFKAFLIAKQQRQDFLCKKAAAIIIQKRFRAYKQGKCQRNQFLNTKSATIKIQRKFRAYLLAKCHRQNFLKIRAAVIVIQRRFKAIRLAKPQRIKFLATKKSTITIQRRFKAFLIAKQQRQDFLCKKAAAIIIQKRFRAYKQGKCQRNQFLNTKSATIKIQRKFRAYLLAKCHRQNFLKIRAAVIVIQRRFKAIRVVKKYREQFCLIKKATVTIQRKFRAHLLTKNQRKEFLEKKRAAILLQRRFRNNKEVKYERNKFLAIKAAAVAIQRRFRANKLGKAQRDHFLTMKSAALVLQKRFREYITTQLQREDFIAKRTAALVIQRRYRAHKQALSQRKSFMSLKTATIKIQRRFRALLFAKHQRQVFLELKATTIKIQRRFRSIKQGRMLRKEFISKRNAAVAIQRRFRANKLGKAQRDHFLNIKSAALKIQERFREYVTAKRQREDFIAKQKAALIIQRRYRAHKQAISQRKTFMSLKTATIKIQRRFRNQQIAVKQRRHFLELKCAAVVIQRTFRQHKMAKQHRTEFITIRTAVIKIQRRFRALVFAKRQRQYFLELKAATIKIQRRFRSIKQGRMLRKEFIFRKNAAVLIQRRFRSLLLAKRQRQHFLELKAATIKIQSKFRSIKQGRMLRREFINKKDATVKIQRKFKALQIAKQQRNKFLKIKDAAILIQRRFRATLLRNTERNNLQALKSATVAIQRRFRANKLAKSQREHFLAIKSAAIIIQTRFKAFLNFKQVRQEFIRMKTAVLTIQRAFRGFKETKYQREKFLGLKNVTITIQRRFRAKVLARQHRQEYISLQNAAVTIQRRFRAKKIAQDQRRDFIIFRSAAITIQRKFREKLRAKTALEESFVNRKINAAVRLQAAWRGYLVRRTVKVPQPPKPKQASFDAPSENHQPISTRGQRYFAVLSDHKKYSVAELQNTLFNIDKITVLLADQCEYYVRNGAVKILYEILVRQSNRACGVQTCVELILSILLNLYRAPTTADSVWKETREVNGIYYVFDLMMRFKTEKTSNVFCKACTVIWLFAQDPEKAEVIMNTPKVQEIYKYIMKSMKKNELPGPSRVKQESKRTEQSRLTAKSELPGPSCYKWESKILQQTRSNVKKPVSATRKKFPALRFNWGNYFDDLRAFDDKSFALSAIEEKLKTFLKS